MGPKSTLRLMRTLGSSLASLAQSFWSLLSNALGGRIASMSSLDNFTAATQTTPVQAGGLDKLDRPATVAFVEVTTLDTG